MVCPQVFFFFSDHVRFATDSSTSKEKWVVPPHSEYECGDVRESDIPSPSNVSAARLYDKNLALHKIIQMFSIFYSCRFTEVFFGQSQSLRIRER